MPIVEIKMLKGRSMDQKRKLVKKITDVMAEVVHADPDHVTVIITEKSNEEWARGGEFIIPSMIKIR